MEPLTASPDSVPRGDHAPVAGLEPHRGAGGNLELVIHVGVAPSEIEEPEEPPAPRIHGLDPDLIVDLADADLGQAEGLLRAAAPRLLDRPDLEVGSVPRGRLDVAVDVLDGDFGDPFH
jgi:hypothetical protein